jgi:hypothetical protein
MPPGNPGDPRYRKHIDALLKACDRHKGELASDNSILVGNAPAESFSPCFGTADCPVKKTVMFSLPEATEVLIKYDLGQSHGCCADHLVGALRILLDGAEVLTDRIPITRMGLCAPFLDASAPAIVRNVVIFLAENSSASSSIAT